MELTQQELTIHIGDKVSFHETTNEGDKTYFTGEIKGVVPGDELTVRIDVNDFLTCTIPAKTIRAINGLLIFPLNFNRHISIRVGV